MKVAITGHTRGIGKALLSVFPDVLVFSKSIGYDITSSTDRDRIFSEAQDADVFINNAESEFGQLYLLYTFWENWKDKNKIIVNISSRASDLVHNSTYPHFRYAIQKQALESASIYMSNSHKSCKVTCIKPSFVDTDSMKHVSMNKIDPKELALFIQDVIVRHSTIWVPVVTLYSR